MRADAGRWRLLLRTGDVRWTMIWLGGMAALLLWDLAFLNGPALDRFLLALVNTYAGAALVVLFALLLGWLTGVALYMMERRDLHAGYYATSFLLNLFRSIPQIVGILAGYVVLTLLIEREILVSPSAILFWMSAVIATVVFLGITDLVRHRVDQFAAMDFYPAMLCLGVSEWRIINIDILWKNSRAHLLHVMIATFGTAVFLQCSIDFVLSVGLSTEVSATNFPVTLGGLLATLDSKQDILAVGTVLSDPGYAGELFFRHLQGVSVAFALVFTLVCIHRIAEGFVRRHRL